MITIAERITARRQELQQLVASSWDDRVFELLEAFIRTISVAVSGSSDLPRPTLNAKFLNPENVAVVATARPVVQVGDILLPLMISVVAHVDLKQEIVFLRDITLVSSPEVLPRSISLNGRVRTDVTAIADALNMDRLVDRIAEEAASLLYSVLYPEE